MADITLSSAVRANLNTLQSTAQFMSDVQNKLATGKKVNSALDNPNSFFTASGLTSRANDLSTLLDDMGQSTQTLKAADQGISSITKLVESAKAKANQALQMHRELPNMEALHLPSSRTGSGVPDAGAVVLFRRDVPMSGSGVPMAGSGVSESETPPPPGTPRASPRRQHLVVHLRTSLRACIRTCRVTRVN